MSDTAPGGAFTGIRRCTWAARQRCRGGGGAGGGHRSRGYCPSHHTPVFGMQTEWSVLAQLPVGASQGTLRTPSELRVLMPAPCQHATWHAPSAADPLLSVLPAGHLLAATRDVGFPCGPPELLDAGWQAGQPYFNSGLLLLDLQVRAPTVHRRRHPPHHCRSRQQASCSASSTAERAQAPAWHRLRQTTCTRSLLPSSTGPYLTVCHSRVWLASRPLGAEA